MLWAWLLVAVTAWILGSHYFGDTDQGYIQGLAWRIFRGETIYETFDYVRPPLSPWFHSIWFHLFGGSGGLLTGRMFMVFQLAIAGWCQLEILGQGRGTREKNGIWLFLAVFFLSLHNFPAMPWHTIDGIFWGSIGLWLLRRDSRVLFSGWILIGFAVLTKQSFYLLPFLAILWLILDTSKSPNKRLYQLGFMLVLAMPAVYLSWDFWANMLSWTSGASSIQDLIQVGVVGYVVPLGLAVGCVGAKEWLNRSGRTKVTSWIYPVAIIGLAGIWLMKMVITQESTPPPFRMAHILFWIAVWEAGKLAAKKEPQGVAWLLLLGLGWCASLSWGYQTPILVAAPLMWILKDGAHCSPLRVVLPLVPICLITIVGFFYPYREIQSFSPAPERLIEAYPALQFIHPGPEIQAELMELDSLRSLYPGSFTVLPNWPQVHVLTETDNPLRIDWAHNTEARFESDFEAYLPGLQRCEVIFVDKDRIDKAEQEGKYGSLLLKEVLTAWETVAEGEEFMVLRKRPKKQ